MKEIWKIINKASGLYLVSNYGNIKNTKTGRILKPIDSTKGYNQIILSYKGRHYRYFIHRLVAIAFISNPDNKPQINHKDGDKKNNRVENIEWVTASENLHHAFNSGIRKDRGDNHYMCKIKESERSMIFELRNNGLTYKAISEIYNVSESHIWRIINNKVGIKNNDRIKVDTTIVDIN